LLGDLPSPMALELHDHFDRQVHLSP
jgi:hypothetical protein